MNDNVTQIKNRTVNNWIKDIWINSSNFSVSYYRKEKFVKIMFDDYSSYYRTTTETKELYFPILNSYVQIPGIAVALAPWSFSDKYASSKFIFAGGYTVAAMAGLKIHLKDIGIQAKIIKSDKASIMTSEFSRNIYRIYPKTDIDYSMFAMYFSNDIGEEKNHYLMNSILLPRIKKVLPKFVADEILSVQPMMGPNDKTK